MNKELAVVTTPLADLREMARAIAASKMFGVEDEDQALALMLLCQAEGLHPVLALRRYHIIEGRPAFRADALQGEFEKEGVILWHVRTERECAATFWREKKFADKVAIKRAHDRYKALKDGKDAADLAWPDEITIIRTIEDAIEKKVAMRWNREVNKWVMKHSWQQSPRQMLHARCLTEGVRAINPGLVAGVYTEDEIIDIPPDEHGEQVSPEIVERNVREATANATDEGTGTPEQLAAFDKTLKAVWSDAVTAENYRDVVVHVGKAEGEVLGKKVGELHPNVVEWLYKKWREKLTPMADDKDMRLKAAIEFAWSDIQKSQFTAKEPETPPQPANVAAPSASSEAPDGSGQHPPDTKRAGEAYTRPEMIEILQDRISDLMLTDPQACGYLQKQGLLTGDQNALKDVPDKVLRLLMRADMWKLFKDTVEAELKPPKVEGGPPKKGRK